MKIQVTAYPIQQFHWSPSERSLTADLSDLGPGFRFERLYDDAVDLGLAIQGRGKVHRFYLSDSEKDGEGEVVRCVLLPEESNCPVERVFLFND